MLTNIERLQAVREAATVQRCHTVRHQGSYDVAQHSFGVASIILCLHPNPSLDLVRAALFHDTAERWMGDFPASINMFDSAIGEHLKTVDKQIRNSLGTNVDLCEDDQRWLRGADILDLWLWCVDHGDDSHAVAYIKNHARKRLLDPTLPAGILNFLEHQVNSHYRVDLLAEKIEKGLKST